MGAMLKDASKHVSRNLEVVKVSRSYLAISAIEAIRHIIQIHTAIVHQITPAVPPL